MSRIRTLRTPTATIEDRILDSGLRYVDLKDFPVSAAVRGGSPHRIGSLRGSGHAECVVEELYLEHQQVLRDDLLRRHVRHA